jgi:uncharacterized membrane protein YccC
VNARTAFWTALTRWEKNKIVSEIAARNAAGFVLAVILGTVFGSPSTGAVAGTGALNVSYSDSRDPYSIRLRRMMISAALVAVAVTLGALTGNSSVMAIAVATLWAFGSGMLVALGTTAGDLGVITLVTLVVFAARPLPPLLAIETGMTAFAGALLQVLLSIALWPWRRYEPEKRIIADLYASLARMSRAPGTALDAPPITPEISHAQEALRSLAGDHGIEAERLVLLLSQAERIRLSILNLGRVSRRVGRAENGKVASDALNRVLAAAAEALTGNPEPFANEMREFRERDWGAPSPFFAALIRDARRQVDALGGQMRTASGVVRHPVEVEDKREPWRLRLTGRLARLQANLSLDSTVFRHALRLALCVGVGDALGRALSVQRTYWVPMTIAIVLKPDFTATFSRGVLRLVGTLAGLVFATALFHFAHTGITADIVLLGVFMFLMRWVGPANYGIFVTALSAMVVLLIAVTGIAPRDVIAARAINTSIGGVVAMIAYALWPSWERTQTSAVLADMLDAYRDYLKAVMSALAGGDPSEIDRVRLDGRLARSNAEASLDRASGEPGAKREEIDAFNAILAHSHGLVRAVMALESGVYRTRPVAIRPASAEFAGMAQDVLAACATSLRERKPPPRDLPDLREAHNRIVGTPESAHERYTLVNIETDRIVTTLNTIVEQLRALYGPAVSRKTAA